MRRRAHILATAILAVLTGPAPAETVIAARTIPAQTIIRPGDLGLSENVQPGAIEDPASAIGLEARVTLYQGRPVHAADIGPPAMVERNQIVALLYDQSGLTILTDGRALDRAARGERVRVMNLASRITVTGTVTGPGEISVP